jgi:hypothetical protein
MEDKGIAIVSRRVQGISVQLTRVDWNCGTIAVGVLGGGGLGLRFILGFSRERTDSRRATGEGCTRAAPVRARPILCQLNF